MSSLLRSTKFVRYFAGAARTLLLNSAKTAEANVLVYSKPSSAIQNVVARDYATVNKTESLEPLLLKLDSEVRRYGRISKKDIDEVFDEIKNKQDISSSQSLLVIRCCGELVPEELPEQRTHLVQKIWSVLSEIGVPMDISHYNALLKVYIENKHPFSPAAFLEDLEKKGLQPNRVTYQNLMWRYCQEGDVDGATKVLEKMRELGHPVSEPVLNALVMGHAFHGDTEGAKAILATMTGAGLEPSNRTYSLLACGYAKKGDIENVENTIRTANEKEIMLTDKDYFDIIEAFATSGHGNNIQHMFGYLHKGPGYNQDVCNLVLRLINNGQEQVAKEIMKTMLHPASTNDNMYRGAFFVKHIIKMKQSPQEVIKLCRELQEENLVPHALFIATESAMSEGLLELSQELFKELQKSGMEIRQHYYWPLLVKKGQENDEEGLLQLLRNMVARDLMPTGETLREYVFPYLIGKDSPQNILLKLKIANIPTIFSVRNFVHTLLESGNVTDAADIVLQYRIYGYRNFLRQPLVNALTKTNDIESFAKILHVISSGTYIDEDNASGENQNGDSTVNEAGNTVQLAVKKIKHELHEKLFDALLSRGIRISTASAEAIQQYIGEKMTQSISEKLIKLTSPDLKLAPLENTPHTTTYTRNANAAERQASYDTSKSTSKHKLQKDQLLQYMAQNDVKKVNQMLEELEEQKFELKTSTIAYLVEFYATNNNIDKALEYKELFSKNFPELNLHNSKLIQCATAMVQAGKFDEAVKFLVENKKEAFESSISATNKGWQLLNHLAESKDAEKVLEMTNVLIENNYVEPSNIILGPSIKVFLLNDDIEGALKQFEHCSKKFRSTPWKGEIMKCLIKKEDATRLQWVADISTLIHGEVNILHDLVLAFIECGRLRQARRILETPGLRTTNKRLNDACKRYVETDKAEPIEGLLEVTKDLSSVDRSQLFYHLLSSYCNRNETEKALGLWTILQEEGEVPSEEFLIKLAEHLKEKGKPIPFAVPAPPKVTQKETKIGNIQAAERFTVNKAESTDIVNQLVLEGKLDQALKFTIKCFESGTNIPRYSTLRFMLKTLAEKGDVESIKLFGEVIKTRDKIKREVAYDDKLTLAIFKGGNGEQHLNTLYNEVFAAKSEEELTNALKMFPRSNALATVIQDAEALNKCTKIVEYAASKNVYLPANLLWMELIIAGKENEANDLWHQTLAHSTSLVYRRLLQEAHAKNKPTIAENLIGLLKSNKNLPITAVGNVYSRLINIHLYYKNINEAKDAFERAMSENIPLEHIGKTTVTRLKSELEAAGQEFNHPIPS